MTRDDIPSFILTGSAAGAMAIVLAVGWFRILGPIAFALALAGICWLSLARMSRTTGVAE